MAQATTNENVTVSEDSGLTVLNCIREAKKEAEEAKRRRMGLNRQNLRTYMGQQDFSGKQQGQSREFLPKTPVAIEQFSAFVKKSLIQFGNWFSVDVPEGNPLDGNAIRNLLKYHLDYLADGMRDYTTFALRVSDGVKISLMEAVMTFKIHGYQVPEKRFFAERGTKFMESGGEKVLVKNDKLIRKTFHPWRLAIDLVRAEDYFPDPTGRKLYEVHHVERDLHDVIELAEQGIYDPDIVEQIASDFDDRQKEYQTNAIRNQQGVVAPAFRKTVGIDEYWGDILDEMGHVVARNQVCAMANDKYLIREPEDNPWWHGESPFVSFPLIRVPDTVWHKALFDHASPLNIALNEIFNLVLDGGLASVWGIKQLRTHGLEDPRQVSGGVPQGITLAVKEDFPQGEKILETVATGQVPQDALATYNLADREFNAAALTNDLKMGLLPQKEVRACVPLNSEILTKRGWKRWDEAIIYEDVLAFNPEKDQCEWVPLLAVSKFENVPTIRYSHKYWDVTCTPDHKWPWKIYDTRKKCFNGDNAFLASIEEVQDQGPAVRRVLINTARCPDGPGLIQNGHRPDFDRSILPDQVLQMTSQERRAYLLGLLAGEGFTKSNESGSQHIVFTQKAGPVLESFRLACFLEGIRTGETENSYFDKRTEKVYTKFQSVMYTTPAIWSQFLEPEDAGLQDVWCPTTKYKTWVMRQGSTITITGNTEVVEIQQSQAVTLDGITIDMEQGLTKVVERAWYCILQNANNLEMDEVVAAIGSRPALMLTRMSPAERFANFARAAAFKVVGLSGTLSRVKDFQKFMATMQLAQTNPILAESFLRRFSPDKAWDHILRALNVNPEDIGLSVMEMRELPQRINRTAALAQAFGANGNTPNVGMDQSGGSPSLPAEINQTGNPLTGMGGA